MATIALVGAGGKMGCRITDNLKDSSYDVRYLEVSPAGLERLAQRGLTVAAQDAAVGEADIVILAVPDVAIEKVSRQVVPQMKSGALLMTLDPAAPLDGKVAARADIGTFPRRERCAEGASTCRRGENNNEENLSSQSAESSAASTCRWYFGPDKRCEGFANWLSTHGGWSKVGPGEREVSDDLR